MHRRERSIPPMTITQDSSAPLVVVVGATGIQGGSVIKALAESNKPYRIRGFTRDVTKPVSQALIAKGVEVVTVSYVTDNVKEVFKAFEGANIAFLVTKGEYFDAEREAAEGKMMIDAAKAAGVDRIVWSGLPSISKLSGGKYTHVIQFESKAVVTEYGRRSGVPFADIQAGYYASNLQIPGALLAKQADGSFAIRFPASPTALFPIIDAENDYGLYVRQALEAPTFPRRLGGAFRRIYHAGGYGLSALSRCEKIMAQQITVEQFEKGFAEAGMPPHVVAVYSDAFQAVNEFGYYGGKTTSSVDGLARTPRSWAEFAKTADWSKVLA
ncbi:NmrA domain-containing protein [Mycena venus]|uniref:NmrA domain-containing protein n=1 Tax=Mycena venus TaxID=2733690 RepID=A0A8H6XXB4_9AGAR|nr:NmrA domain-containing protein [Mycena venus]